MLRVFLNSTDKVKEFVGVTVTFDGDIDVVCGRYIVDGKSIMGILSLDLTKELELLLNGVTKDEEMKLVENLKLAGLISK